MRSFSFVHHFVTNLVPLPHSVAKIQNFAESFEGVSADFLHTPMYEDTGCVYTVGRHTVAESLGQVDRESARDSSIDIMERKSSLNIQPRFSLSLEDDEKY